MPYSIRETAALIGVSPSTLRYYDKEGLLPTVERTAGGMRIFKDSDIEWLRIIDCLKKTGMSLKDIRQFIEMVQAGDRTIEARLAMFEHRREKVKEQIAELQKTLDILNYKCWFYTAARNTGTTATPKAMTLEEIPEKWRPVRQYLQEIQKSDKAD
ncbi:MAG: MerR family transcriptional regulator [Oxalobacter sp.]|nr:MerR family transcriptional regulator [Oxalobacter sp.]